MRITNPRHHALKFTAIGCALLAMGLSGCNQGATTASPETAPESATPLPMSQPTLENAIVLPERELVGEELEAFLKTMPKDVDLEAKAAGPSVGLEKAAANPACIINFASNKGLWNMPDRAHTNYAVSPYYYQPCFPQYAFVTPTKYGFYYLGTEASGTCPGAYGMIGYGPVASTDPNVCKNQKDGALFPRYASNASTTYGDMGLTVQMQDASKNSYLFRGSYVFARSGSIKVYGYRPAAKKWFEWGPAQGPGFLVLQNATDLSVLQIFASDKASIFEVDNISITGN